MNLKLYACFHHVMKGDAPDHQSIPSPMALSRALRSLHQKNDQQDKITNSKTPAITFSFLFGFHCPSADSQLALSG
jgi:hypothetical protein